MFHEVKIFDKKGNIKKVLSSKELNNQYWNSFFNNSCRELPQRAKGRGKKSEKSAEFDEEILDSHQI